MGEGNQVGVAEPTIASITPSLAEEGHSIATEMAAAAAFAPKSINDDKLDPAGKTSDISTQQSTSAEKLSIEKQSNAIDEINTFESKSFTASLGREGSTAVTVVVQYDYPVWFRWMLLVVATVCSMFIGPAFFSWSPFAQILRWGDAYIDLCPDGIVDCKDQKKAVDQIQAAATMVMFGFTFIGGIIIDSLGAKISAIFGISIEIIGWVLLGCSGKNFNGFTVGTLMTAAGADAAFFGVLHVANLFPGWNNTVVAVLGAARSLSFGVPLIMQLIWESDREGVSLALLAFSFAGILGFWLILLIVILPYQRFPVLTRGSFSKDHLTWDVVSLKKQVQQKPTVDCQKALIEAKDQSRTLLHYFKSFRYLPLIFIVASTLIRNNFYATSVDSQVGSLKSLYAILSPLSFIPCPLMGVLADRISASFVLGLLQLVGLLTTFFLLFPGVGWMYLSLFANWLCLSFVASQFYCFVSSSYPTNQMGKLSGASLLVGSLIGLVATPMSDYSADIDDYTLMNIICAVMSAVGIGTAYFLWRVAEKPVRAERKRANIVQKKLADTSLSERGTSGVSKGPTAGGEAFVLMPSTAAVNTQKADNGSLV